MPGSPRPHTIVANSRKYLQGARAYGYGTRSD